jgi:5-methylcytosine-specific restriction endonuclease McrBC regulatory subunit McrC
VPLDWTPATAGSQRSLIPDVVLEREDLVVVLDAKYKQHAVDIERLGWSDVTDHLREQHRNDLLQALAYSTLFDAPRVVTLLVYPVGIDAHRNLVQRGRALSMARVRVAPRNIEVGLMAVPLGGPLESQSVALAAAVQRAP